MHGDVLRQLLSRAPPLQQLTTKLLLTSFTSINTPTITLLQLCSFPAPSPHSPYINQSTLLQQPLNCSFSAPSPQTPSINSSTYQLINSSTHQLTSTNRCNAASQLQPRTHHPSFNSSLHPPSITSINHRGNASSLLHPRTHHLQQLHQLFSINLLYNK